MKTLKSASFLVILFLTFLALPGKSLAAVPTLSLNSFNNNSVQVTVNGDPNSSITLYYYSIGNSNVNNIGNIGTTNSSGYFSTNLNNGSYNIPAGSNVYTVVNGQQSNQVNWPYNNNYNNNNNSISFSQNNISLNAGQGMTITIYGASSFYVSSNSNSNIVSSTLSGNALNLYGQNSGSATLTICSSNGNSSCGTLYVNVNGNYGNGNYGGYNNNNNGCYYSNGYYNCPNNNSANYSNPVIYTQTEPSNYSGAYGSPSAGVFLSQVPATGGAVNLKMTLFFLGLFSWSAFLSYLYLSHRALKKSLTNI